MRTLGNILFSAALVAAFSIASAAQERGFTSYASFTGSANSDGQVMVLDPSAGYNFNSYFGVDAGLPFYFVNASDENGYSGGGIGNLYLRLRFNASKPMLNFSSVLTGTAPTGDPDKGLGTGRATVDWTNSVNVPFGPLTPFVSVGIANTVSDRQFFTRPYSTLGLVSHYQAGLNVKAAPFLSVGASAYAVLPSGEQKVYSRLVEAPEVPGLPGVDRTGFRTEHFSVGEDLTRDNGYSTFVMFNFTRFASAHAGFTRSVPYDLNTFAFGIGFNLGEMAKNRY